MIDERGTVHDTRDVFVDNGAGGGFTFFRRMHERRRVESGQRQRGRSPRPGSQGAAGALRQPAPTATNDRRPQRQGLADTPRSGPHGRRARRLVTARDGELIIELAEKGIPDRGRIIGAARVLLEAKSTVLAALAERMDKPLADRLPDEHVRRRRWHRMSLDPTLLRALELRGFTVDPILKRADTRAPVEDDWLVQARARAAERGALVRYSGRVIGVR